MLAERLSHDTSPSVVIMPDLTGDESEDDVKGLVEECRGYLEEVNAGTTNIMASGDMVEFAGHYADASSVVLWRPTKTLKRDVKEQLEANVMAVYTDKKEGGKATEMRCLLKGERDSFVKVFDGDNKEGNEETGFLLATSWINTYGRKLLRTI